MSCIEIKAAENGFIVEYDDPAIVDANQKSSSKWQDPEVYRVYPDVDKLLADLPGLLADLKPESTETDDFESAFSNQSE